ncbi:site-specific DNA-methyltransferase [Campylobacter helveticus]|uniref:Site-specific DNA-methyltransferase n=1 Tax=Campylobacter helveticus TaxID=28898 RepID=A0ABY3L2M7_9BACT|nr:site-specific DNA-methyltransferase [Campylobacter helveticus]
MDFQNTQNQGGTSFTSAKKPEQLIYRIIDMTTNEGDLVMDFFAGSGTTCAVEHKMKRRFVGIEQMDYVESITKERLKKVIVGEQSGISKAVGWSGGEVLSLW